LSAELAFDEVAEIVITGFVALAGVVGFAKVTFPLGLPPALPSLPRLLPDILLEPDTVDPVLTSGNAVCCGEVETVCGVRAVVGALDWEEREKTGAEPPFPRTVDAEAVDILEARRIDAAVPEVAVVGEVYLVCSEVLPAACETLRFRALLGLGVSEGRAGSGAGMVALRSPPLPRFATVFSAVCC
jgi:hypothetical protein